jgi:hypothetical protein
MDVQTKFMFRKNVIFFDFDELSFVIDIAENSLYNLGFSSALIAKHLDGKNNLIKLVEIIKKSYNVSAKDSETAVMKCINMMQQQNLVEEVT